MDDTVAKNRGRPSELQSTPRTADYGDLIVRYLRMFEVDYVFGVPGGAIEPFLNALARGQGEGGPTCIVARHETGAAFMADGYHNVSGRLGVCFATTGPGATNLVTGVASAYANNVPMLVITAQTALENFGKSALQESSCTGTNTLSLFQSITKFNTLISHPDQLEHKLAAALMMAHRSPGGPVHLSIPTDILKTPAREEPEFPYLKSLISDAGPVDDVAVEQFYKLLIGSRRPVFLLGRELGATPAAVIEVAERLEVPLVASPHGKGLINPLHPLFRGVVGFAGHRSAVNLLKTPEVDLVVAIGTSLGEWASNGWDKESVLNHRLVHISALDNHFLDSPMARLHLRGRPDLVFSRIAKRLGQRQGSHPSAGGSVAVAPEEGEFNFTLSDEAAYRSDRVPLTPPRLMAELPRLFPATTRYLADSGNAIAWAIHYLHPRGAGPETADIRGGAFNASLDFASMGWAIGCAVGTALAARGAPVVCITGDGSYLMSSQEITVAIQHRLPVVYLVLNDSAYGMVRHGQQLTGAEPIGFELPFIDFAALAAAMGVPGHLVTSIADLQALDIAKICSTPGPTLLDVRIDPDAKPPMELRTTVLKS